MSRNLASCDCPHCGHTVEVKDLAGGSVSVRKYDPCLAVGVDIACPGHGCARPLFVWLSRVGDEPTFDLSWGRSFNDEPFCRACMDAPCCSKWATRGGA